MLHTGMLSEALPAPDDAEQLRQFHAVCRRDLASLSGLEKSRLGRTAVALGAVIAGARTPGYRMEVLIDGKVVVDLRRHVLMVGIGNAPTIGGGTPMLPDALVDDGLLDVVVSHAVGRWTRLGYALHLKRGVHRDRADVIEVQGRRVTVRAHDFWCNADGELYGPHSDLTWEVQPSAFRLLLPPRSEPSA